MRKNILQRLQKVKPSDLFHIILFLFALFPAVFYKFKHPDLWLVSECKDEARDNGYWFFKYVNENHKEQDILYAIDYNCMDFKKVSCIGKTVKHGSLMHWITYIACSVKISSQKNGGPNDAICYLLNKCKILRKTNAFLQHGIIKDDIPYIHADQANFSFFATTAKREYEYVKNNFGFKDGVVQQTGMCRLDDLRDTSDGNIILVMPTWRQWIANPDYKTKEIEVFHDFTDTEYFNQWQSLLNSKELSEIIQKHNKNVVFLIHRKMREFDKYFYTNNKNISILPYDDNKADIHELLKRASILITDYSSVAMDFAYMGKPVIYYQFDYDRFRNHHLYYGYFNYQSDGFGPVFETKQDIITYLKQSIENDFASEEIYKQRSNEFFDLKDANNCDRTYEVIKKIGGKDDGFRYCLGRWGRCQVAVREECIPSRQYTGCRGCKIP